MKEVFDKPIVGQHLADLHMHTTGSLDVRRRGNGLSPQEAVLSAEKASLHSLAITDHDNLQSSYEAYEFSIKEGLALQVIPGMEVSSRDGHVIAIGLTSPIEKGLPIEDTFRHVHAQKGLVIAAHPFFVMLNSIKRRALSRVLRSQDPQVYFDGFEIYNAGVEDASRRKKTIRDTNNFAQRLYKNHEAQLGAQIGSSDGHRMTVGRGLTIYNGELYDAIKNGKTQALRLEAYDNRQLVVNAIQLFGEKRVLGDMSFEEFEERYKEE